MAPRIAIIADDLTGAIDTIVPFADLGLRCTVSTGPAPDRLDDVDVAAVTLDSRTMTPDAARAVAQTAHASVDAWADIVFKKVNSRLKGNLLAETQVLFDHARTTSLLCAPAIPRLGRVVRDGRVVGTGVTQPIDVRAAFGDAGRGLDIPDTLSDDDLVEQARRMLEGDAPRAVIGASGLARALAMLLGDDRRSRSTPSVDRVVMFAIASRDPQTLAQVDHAQAAGAVRVIAAPDGRIPEHDPQGPLPRLFLCTATDRTCNPSDVARTFGSQVAKQVLTSLPRSLMLCGGDTALAILKELRVTTLIPRGEYRPGVPVSEAMLPDGHMLTVVTKSGGFGEDDIIRALSI